jgi:hypothetical protein
MKYRKEDIMPHTFNQEINAEYVVDYSKALAENCMISGTYESANLYIKKQSDNAYNISFVAYEPKKDIAQIIRSSTRIISLIDFDKVSNTFEEVYKVFQNKIPKDNTTITINSNSIDIVFNLYGEWKINIDNLNQEEINKLTKKIS